MPPEPPSLLGMTPREIEEALRPFGLPAFRARQVADWLYLRRVADPALMLNLPAALRERLSREYAGTPCRTLECAAAPDGTRKLLLGLEDGEAVEMVLIPSPDRMTFCLSTQVGCPVGCRFCASGSAGLVRNLTAGEILGELYAGSELHGALPDNIVFMGIGEGLLNCDNLLRAIDRITDPEGIGMSPRRVTVSTSGIVPGIRRLAEYGRPLTLAVSLHAPDEATRARVIPDRLRYPIADIVAAMDCYVEKSGRMATLEYTLLAGVNDSREQAEALAELALAHHFKVNLIACNPVSEAFHRPSPAAIRRFQEILENRRVHVTLRMEKGTPESAACGQLRIRSARK